jgi:putative transposase
MKTKLPIHPRHNMRLQGYDYSQPGAYFITIVTHHRESLFGQVVNGELHLNRFGKIIQNDLNGLSSHYQNVNLEAFVIMPNHIHAIVIIYDRRGGSPRTGESKGSIIIENSNIVCDAGKTRPYMANSLNHYRKMTVYGLPEIVRAFKSFSARRINQLRKMHGTPIWQRSYYDNIIRNEQDLRKIWDYIETNPQSWKDDQLYGSSELIFI